MLSGPAGAIPRRAAMSRSHVRTRFVVDVGRGPGHRSPHPHPLLETPDRFVGQFAFRRHFEILLLQRAKQQTVLDIAGDDRCPTVAAAEQRSLMINSEPAFD